MNFVMDACWDSSNTHLWAAPAPIEGPLRRPKSVELPVLTKQPQNHLIATLLTILVLKV